MRSLDQQPGALATRELERHQSIALVDAHALARCLISFAATQPSAKNDLAQQASRRKRGPSERERSNTTRACRAIAET